MHGITIWPYKGVNSIEFGMQYETIAKMVEGQLVKGKETSTATLGNILLIFDSEDKCIGIRIFGNENVFVEDIELTNRPISEIARDLLMLDPDMYISYEPDVYSFRLGVDVFDMSFGAGPRSIYVFPLGGCKLVQEMQSVLKVLDLSEAMKRSIDEWMYAGEYMLAYEDIEVQLEKESSETRKMVLPLMERIGAALSY